MDPQLSVFMANQALVRPGDLVFDPFVGTGSLLVAAAKFGGLKTNSYILIRCLNIAFRLCNGRGHRLPDVTC